MSTRTIQSKLITAVLAFLIVISTILILFPPTSSFSENKPQITKISAIEGSGGQFWNIELELDQVISGKLILVSTDKPYATNLLVTFSPYETPTTSKGSFTSLETNHFLLIVENLSYGKHGFRILWQSSNQSISIFEDHIQFGPESLAEQLQHMIDGYHVVMPVVLWILLALFIFTYPQLTLSNRLHPLVRRYPRIQLILPTIANADSNLNLMRIQTRILLVYISFNSFIWGIIVSQALQWAVGAEYWIGLLCAMLSPSVWLVAWLVSQFLSSKQPHSTGDSSNSVTPEEAEDFHDPPEPENDQVYQLQTELATTTQDLQLRTSQYQALATSYDQLTHAHTKLKDQAQQLQQFWLIAAETRQEYINLTIEQQTTITELEAKVTELEEELSVWKPTEGELNALNIADLIKRYDDNLVAELQALIEPYNTQIDDYAKARANQITLNGKKFSEAMIKICVKIQLITNNRWLAHRHLNRAIGISRNEKSLRKVKNSLLATNFLQDRRNLHPNSSNQEVRLIKPFIKMKFED